MNQVVFEQVKSIISDFFNIPIEQINGASSPETIEKWEFLQHLNVVLTLEQEFAMSFSPEEIATMLSVEEIAQLITKKQEREN